MKKEFGAPQIEILDLQKTENGILVPTTNDAQFVQSPFGEGGIFLGTPSGPAERHNK